MTTNGSVAERRRDGFLPGLAVVMALAVIAAFFGIGLVRQVMSEWSLGQSPWSYFLPGHAFSLYIGVPLATLATGAVLMAPGLTVCAVTGRDKSVAFWLLSGFGASAVILTLATTVFQLATGHVLTGQSFLLLVVGVGFATVAFAGLRLSSGQRLRIEPADLPDLWVALALSWAILVLMAPKFYWENLSGDGADTLQLSRLFIHTLWPFWPDDAGVIKQAPGLTSFLVAVPDSWFVRLWGELEYAIRAPYALALTLLYPILTRLIRTGRPGARLRPVDHLLLAATLYLYSLSVIYSGGYHPWFGEGSMPGVRETLAMVFFMGYILAFAEDRRGLMMAAGIMAHLTIPTGGLWLLLWPLSVILCWRPVPWARIRSAGLVLIVAALISTVLPHVISALHLPLSSDEFSAKSVVQRLRFVSIIDWSRFGFLAIPIGILPVLFLFTWKRQDQMSRALTLLTAVFFLFFYLQAYRVLLHHFIPAMFPPIVVMWRSPLMRGAAMKGAVAVGLVAGLYLAVPRQWQVHGHDRAFAAYIETRGPRFASAVPLDGERFRGFDPKALDTMHVLFKQLLPIGYGEDEPSQRFFGAPLVWYYYSEFPKDPGQPINYIVEPLADATPADGVLFASHDGYGLFVRDQAVFDQQRNQHLAIDTGAWALRTPRDIIFGLGAKWPATWNERTIIDLVPIARRMLGLKAPPQEPVGESATTTAP